MDRACEALRMHWKRAQKVERADVLRAALRMLYAELGSTPSEDRGPSAEATPVSARSKRAARSDQGTKSDAHRAPRDRRSR